MGSHTRWFSVVTSARGTGPRNGSQVVFDDLTPEQEEALSDVAHGYPIGRSVAMSLERRGIIEAKKQWNWCDMTVDTVWRFVPLSFLRWLERIR